MYSQGQTSTLFSPSRDISNTLLLFFLVHPRHFGCCCCALCIWSWRVYHLYSLSSNSSIFSLCVGTVSSSMSSILQIIQSAWVYSCSEWVCRLLVSAQHYVWIYSFACCACSVFSRTVACASKLQTTSKPVEGNLFVLLLSHELDASFPPRANSSLIMLFSSRIISNLVVLVHINRLALGHFKDAPDPSPGLPGLFGSFWGKLQCSSSDG